ncbi:MAG: ATP-dependent zinc metalloprotease FtsH, partial [Nitrospinota bacterium]
MNGKNRFQFSIWYLLAFLLIMIWVQGQLMGSRTRAIPYSDFKALLKADRVAEVSVGKDKIVGRLRGKGPEGRGDAFETARLEDPELLKELETRGVKYSGKIESNWTRDFLFAWIFPMAIFFLIWSFFIKRMGAGAGVMTFGRNRAKLYAEDETKVSFADVAGVDEAKEELQEIVEFLKHPSRFQRLGGKIPKGVLLVGPPGTGKTLLARAVAGEAGVPFFSISGSEFVEMFVGVGASRVRDLFQQAQAKAPCIVFIDELDAVGKTRGLGISGGHDEREQTLNQLLVEMDGFDTRKGVIIMSATNRPETLDIALLRPGRFDRHVVVDKPDLKGREAILRVHVRNVRIAPSVNLKTLAARTPGLAGADLANIVNEAALLAARRRKDVVEMEDFEDAIDRVLSGLEKKSRVMNEEERRRVAYHEVGHALVAESVKKADPVHKVSIIPRGLGALGYTLQLPTEDRYLLTRSELLDRLAVLLGGRAAEEMVFGEVSTGAQNDLQRATEIARSMVKDYGMSEKLGPLSYGRERRPIFLDNLMPQGAMEYGEKIADAIDAEVKRIIEEAHQKVKDILKAQKE